MGTKLKKSCKSYKLDLWDILKDMDRVSSTLFDLASSDLWYAMCVMPYTSGDFVKYKCYTLGKAVHRCEEDGKYCAKVFIPDRSKDDLSLTAQGDRFVIHDKKENVDIIIDFDESVYDSSSVDATYSGDVLTIRMDRRKSADSGSTEIKIK